MGTIPYLKGISLSHPGSKLSTVLPQDDMMDKSNIVSISYQIGVASVGLVSNFLYWFSWDGRADLAEVNKKHSFNLVG